MSLPPLPEPIDVWEWTDADLHSAPIFTAEAMRAFYADGVRAGMEQAAVIAEGEKLCDPNTESDGDIAYDLAIGHVVDAIRAAAKQPASENNAAHALGYQYNGTRGRWGVSIVGQPGYQAEQREKNRKARALMDGIDSPEKDPPAGHNAD